MRYFEHISIAIAKSQILGQKLHNHWAENAEKVYSTGVSSDRYKLNWNEILLNVYYTVGKKNCYDF